MKELLIIPFISIVLTKLVAQTNLVPNPSFEEYWSCPGGYSELYKTKYWKNGGASPDYFNCGLSGGVPKNTSGFQYPSTGNAYAGGATFSTFPGQKNIREMIYVKLTSALSLGEKYYISFKVSPAYSYQNYHNIFTNNLSALFTTYSLDSMNGNAPNKAHIINTSIINDTTNWTRIKGSFIADSSYKYLVLGNLLDSTTILVDSTVAYFSGLIANSAYCYFDDVCVSTDSNFSYNYVPTRIKTTVNDETEIFVYPNPTKEVLMINGQVITSDMVVKIYSTTGVLVAEQTIGTASRTINIKTLPNAVYFINFEKNNTTVYRTKFVKE